MPHMALQRGLVHQQMLPGACPILVMAPNTSTRNMLTGYLTAWGADVSAAADLGEAATYLDGDRPTGTAILSLSLCKWHGLTPPPFAAPAARRLVPKPLLEVSPYRYLDDAYTQCRCDISCQSR